MHNKNELKILSKSIDLAEKIYTLAASFPKEEIYGMVSQIRKCAVSIPSNIAEGAGRNSNKEFMHFLSIANGSGYELEIQLTLCERLCFASSDEITPIKDELTEVLKMNYKLQQHLIQ